MRTICTIALAFTATVLAVSKVIAGDSIFIRANQVGYSEDDPKSAVAFSSQPLPDAFEVVPVDSDQAVFKGEARPATNSVWGRFSQHAELDFSAFNQPGNYQLLIGGVRSFPFHIGNDNYSGLPS